MSEPGRPSGFCASEIAIPAEPRGAHCWNCLRSQHRSTKCAFLPADPEIYFRAGTELLLRLTAPVNIPHASTQPLRIAPFSPDEIAELHRLLKNSAQRARQGSHPSNLVNLLFFGSRQQLGRAFYVAGWSLTEERSAMSLYRMYYALTVQVGYKRAPMDTLTSNGVPSDFEYQKV